ncbi:esterase E4 [Manduca sexta]|uniref:esterase E4 n=1 Tax=Manduca sexta TaxID=7130 RepID=UPI00188EBB50|nr:esterase E4 [Manduca sexta]
MLGMRCFKYILLIQFFINVCSSENNVQVKLEQGVLLGKTNVTLFKEQSYYVFEGIPYAEPPVGKLRFQPPVPHKGWEGIYEALENKPTCLQLNARMRNGEEFGISGSEDCLYINVFTPNLQASAPVIVFDYNDNFRTGFNGSKTYSPQFFVEEGVIVVTLNHRLGVLGYLTTENDVIPGNNGLRDFILGLQWVQKNIKEFGGDPNRVTIMGNRGGATIAEIMLYSEKAKGLFSAVIMQSGSAFESLYFYKNPQEKAFALGKIFEVETDDSKVLLEALQNASAEELLIKEIEVLDNIDEDFKQHSTFPFTPTVEPDSPNAVLKFIPEEGKIVNDVPIIFGFNSREGLDLASHFLFVPRLMTHDVELGILHVPIRVDFAFHTKDPAYKEASREIIDFYFEHKSIHDGNILEYAAYAGDAIHMYAYHKAIKKLMNEVKSSIYYYMFDFCGQFSENSYYLRRRSMIPIDPTGASITDELCYLHLCTRMEKYYKDIKNLPSDPKEIKILRRMVRMWANFAKTRNPTPDKDDGVLNGFTWEPLDKSEDLKYLHVSKNLRMKTNPIGDRVAFWDQFLEKYSQMVVDGVVRKPEIVKDEL